MNQPESPAKLYAGTGNRVLATIIDFMLLVFLTAVLSEISQQWPYTMPLLALGYLAVMPLTPLQGSLGKWICRVRLCDRLGSRLSWRGALLRAGSTMAWFSLPIMFSLLSSKWKMPTGQVLGDIWWLLFLIPWASIGFRARRESAFDLIAGTLVVTWRAEPQQIATDAGVRGLRLFSGAATLLLCLAVGAMIQSMLDVYKVRGMRGRITYAIQETIPLRAKVQEFRDQMNRWPTAAELGVPDVTPYPDGGHFSLQANGRIVIRFSVLPELKGRGLTFSPSQSSNEAYINWQCSVDNGLDSRYLPSPCRQASLSMDSSKPQTR